MLALDRAAETTARRDVDGRLHVVANISKATVNPYKGSEIPGWEGLGLEPDRVYQMYRPAEELRKAASTFNGLPLLIDHRPIDAEDHPRQLVCGAIGTDCRWDEPHLVASRSGVRTRLTRLRMVRSASFRVVIDMCR
jgi:uncharacterized protein